MGITSCGLAFFASLGLCSAFGLSYGPMHSIIPCLMVGLGVDDMFVIVQALNNVEAEDKLKGLVRAIPDRIGDAMRHAGVGITITSFTDFVVFSVGATTVLPSLRSYSFFTAVGILFTYFLQSTFFVAWLSIDQARIDARRDGTFCWKSYGPDWEPNPCSQRSFLQEGFGFLGKIMQKMFVKVSVKKRAD